MRNTLRTKGSRLLTGVNPHENTPLKRGYFSMFQFLFLWIPGKKSFPYLFSARFDPISLKTVTESLSSGLRLSLRYPQLSDHSRVCNLLRILCFSPAIRIRLLSHMARSSTLLRFPRSLFLMSRLNRYRITSLDAIRYSFQAPFYTFSLNINA